MLKKIESMNHKTRPRHVPSHHTHLYKNVTSSRLEHYHPILSMANYKYLLKVTQPEKGYKRKSFWFRAQEILMSDRMFSLSLSRAANLHLSRQRAIREQ